MRPPSPYLRLAQREVYRNRWVAVEVHDIVHPTGAGDAFVLARQARFAPDSHVLEIVSFPNGGTEN
jgi:hypothetical protein